MGIENVVRIGVKTPLKKGGDFPALYWNEDGSTVLVKSAAEVPAGATPFNPKDKAAKDKKAAVTATAKPKAQAPATPAKTADTPPPPSGNAATGGLNRQQIVEALQRKNVKFNAQAATKNLYDLLVATNEANS